MQVREQRQQNPVSDEVLALTAVVRPILTGVYALKADIVKEAGGYENVKLKMLPRLYNAGDGDCGICFEYAVHEAISRGDARVIERIEDAARLCNVSGTAPPRSILFGLEKTGTQQLIDTASNVLTDNSRLLYGTRGQPAKLKRHLSLLAGAFRNRQTRLALPYSIRGLWKADLFVGYTDVERWVATTVKINPSQLEGAAGLRIGIVPTRQGSSDKVRKDENKNLVVCPLHHDEDFMQTFYEGWRIVQAFIDAKGEMPREVLLPRPAHREVARILVERREHPVVEVVDAIAAFSQPGLLVTEPKQVGTTILAGQANTDLLIAPLSRDRGLFD